jgi:hypothetical protein
MTFMLPGTFSLCVSICSYNKLVGSHDASDEFTDDDEDEGQEEQEAVMAQQQQRPGAWASEESPELSPSPSSGALASPGSTAPAQDHLDSPNSGEKGWGMRRGASSSLRPQQQTISGPQLEMVIQMRNRMGFAII